MREFSLDLDKITGSGTCLPQESKGSGTLSGSKAETNDDAVSTSRSESIQPNNLDLAFDKSNVDDQVYKDCMIFK
jgi:hypothetical protein